MKKKQIGLLSVLMVVVIGIAGIILTRKGDLQEGQKTENTIDYGNGDFIYIPEEEDIGYESEANIFYYKNIINVYLQSEVPDEEAEALADVVKGKIVGKIEGATNILQLQVEEAESLEELKQLTVLFEEEELVRFADTSSPTLISDVEGTDSYDKTWGEEEAVDEENPAGNNWWAEAIQAYSAWETVDTNQEAFEEVNVAILESGNLDNKHEDLSDHLTDENIHNHKEGNLSDHALNVTRLITATKDSEEIRGVAADVADVLFRNIGNNRPELSVLAAIKASVVDDEAKVINNSWGIVTSSEEHFKKEQGKKGTLSKLFSDKTYEEYLATKQKMAERSAVELIYFLDDLFEAGHEEVLFVQAAGNSLLLAENEELENSTLDAKHTGYFAGIDEATYSEAEKNRELSKTLEEIKGHILVVGGAEQSEETAENYQSPIWASHGEVIDIAAPASAIYLINEEEHILLNGTSYATPIVSGAAALAWSHHPNLTAEAVKNVLLYTATKKVEEQEGQGKASYPLLNLANIVTYPNVNKPQSYQGLATAYQTAIDERWEKNQLVEANLGPKLYEEEPLPSSYGYVYQDVNNDGIPEMLFGANEEGEPTTYIDEIYTVIDEKPVKILESAIRTSISIKENGVIAQNVVTNSYEGISETQFYTLDSAGNLIFEDGYITSWDEENLYQKLNIEWETTYDNWEFDGGSMSQEEVDALEEKYGDSVEYSFDPIVEETKATTDSTPTTKEEATSEVDPAFKDIINTYQTAIAEQWSYESDFTMHFANVPFPKSYGYVLKDLNNDGTFEMFTGNMADEEPIVVQEIWSIIDGRAVWIAQANYMDEYFITSEGIVIARDLREIEKGLEKIHYFEIDAGGSLAFKAGYLEDKNTDTYQALHYEEFVHQDPRPELEPMTKGEVENMQKEFGEPARFDYTPFIEE